MEADDAAHRDGEHAEGVVVPEILLRGEGEPFQIVQGFDVVRLDAGLVEGPPVKADGMVNPLDDLFEPLELQGLQHLARQCFELLVVDHRPGPPLVYRNTCARVLFGTAALRDEKRMPVRKFYSRSFFRGQGDLFPCGGFSVQAACRGRRA